MDEGRLFDCTRCGTTVRVFELPGPFIDPDLYVGVVCRRFHPDASDDVQGVQLALGTDGEVGMEEVRRYDPAIAEIPF